MSLHPFLLGGAFRFYGRGIGRAGFHTAWRRDSMAVDFIGASQCIRRIHDVPVALDGTDIDAFRHIAFVPEKPLLLHGCEEVPARKKWFQPNTKNTLVSLANYLWRFRDDHFPYEIVINSSVKETFSQLSRYSDTEHQGLYSMLLEEWEASDSDFQRFTAPLCLMLEAVEFNEQADRPIQQLYIAQCQLNDLDADLQADLPVPEIVKHAGKGDIYDSSLWLGLQPTYTPLHRDPNPNLFLQMVGSKIVRLLPPRRGQQLYARLRRELGGGGNAHIRGDEMMRGSERAAFFGAIWGEQPVEDIYEAVVSPGDQLFIPKGWWHSVLGGKMSNGSNGIVDGRLNASVNWWFR